MLARKLVSIPMSAIAIGLMPILAIETGFHASVGRPDVHSFFFAVRFCSFEPSFQGRPLTQMSAKFPKLVHSFKRSIELF